MPAPAIQAYDIFGEPYRTTGDGAPWGKHELVPLRLNSGFNWYEGALKGYGPDWSSRYLNPWGQIFIGTGNTATNVRLQVRNAHCVYLASDDTWKNVKTFDPDAQMEGAYYDTFFNNQGIENDIRSEASNGGGWSVSLAPLVNNTNVASWHWWHTGFYPRPIMPAGAKALLTAIQVRLIPDDTNPDDPASEDCKFIASFGCDAWESATTGDPPITAFYQPRMKRVRDEWVWITGHSFVDFWTSGFGPSQILAQPVTAWPS